MSAYRTTVESLSLYATDEVGASVHYQLDPDLHARTKAASDGGEVSAVVFVELGIDGYATHGVRLDYGVAEPDGLNVYRHGDEVRALTDAIEAMTAVRDELERVGSR